MLGASISPAFAQQFEEPEYTIRGAEILGFEIDQQSLSLIVTLDARARGELIITLPRYLIDAKAGSVDDMLGIFVSGLQLVSYDETVTAFDRTVTIPLKRGNSEIIITGTHVFSKAPQTIQRQSTEHRIQAELETEMPKGEAKLLIFSDTAWSGALESSSFEYAEITGRNDKSVVFECESFFGSQGVFGARIEKLTQDGYVELVVIQNQEILSHGITKEQLGSVLVNGKCAADSSTGPESGGCLVATATFGSEMAPQVQQLRELRDDHLLNTRSGTIFMESFNKFYYSFSPYIADYERENSAFREVVRLAITPMLTSLSVLNHVDMDSESSVIIYGVSLILLNGMMYVGIPAMVIVGIRKRFQ